MNSEEIQSLISQLKAAGLSEEEIMDVLYTSFEEGKMDRKDLETLAGAMGYELTDDFKNDPKPDPIASKGVEGLSKESLEDAKEIEPGESAEEFKEKIESTEPIEGEKEESTEVESKENSEESKEDEKSEDSDEEDWDKAQKMFKI